MFSYGRPKGPNGITASQEYIFSHPDRVDPDTLARRIGISGGYAESLLGCFSCFDLATGRLRDDFDRDFNRDNSKFCNKCPFGPLGKCTMCARYPFPQADSNSGLSKTGSEEERYYPSHLLICNDKCFIAPDIWHNAMFIAGKEGLELTRVPDPYPQDDFVCSDSGIITYDYNKLPKFSRQLGETVVINNILYEGGLYAFGNKHVFCAAEDLRRAEFDLLSHAFNTRIVHVITPPDKLGLFSENRISGHLDQYMGAHWKL